ncbi:MAG: hypothetical protein KGQ46_13075 [Hyphomicrobiales bacterium]|nr:hypothetical protein [Hyphomicrobiales bacterium]MDE2113913.1 hypothetical protein [Hyphomicrobiales bacterium]
MAISSHFRKTDDFGFSNVMLDNQPRRQFRLAVAMICVLALAVFSLGWSTRVYPLLSDTASTTRVLIEPVHPVTVRAQAASRPTGWILVKPEAS